MLICLCWESSAVCPGCLYFHKNLIHHSTLHHFDYTWEIATKRRVQNKYEKNIQRELFLRQWKICMLKRNTRSVLKRNENHKQHHSQAIRQSLLYNTTKYLASCCALQPAGWKGGPCCNACPRRFSLRGTSRNTGLWPSTVVSPHFGSPPLIVWCW